jgi:hypothetical protein
MLRNALRPFERLFNRQRRLAVERVLLRQREAFDQAEGKVVARMRNLPSPENNIRIVVRRERLVNGVRRTVSNRC